MLKIIKLFAVCGDPPVINNGQINLDIDGEYFYQDTATVSCIQGYFPTIPQIECTNSGSWSTVQCGRIGKVGFSSFPFIII